MNEKLLQFLWRFQYFNQQLLLTTQHEQLRIENPGNWNNGQGPDFSEASIRINNTRWVGNIELHLRSSDWFRHRHQSDLHYTNIILHVVWDDDAAVYDGHGNPLPTLVLAPLVPKLLLQKYAAMMATMQMIPCHRFLPAMSHLAWCSWKERLAAERLERKSGNILLIYRQTGQNWEALCWWLLAGNFGTRVNSLLFEEVARTIPLAIMAKHSNQLHQLEALLLGQANLLAATYTDPYPVMLQKEYRFLQHKYKLRFISNQPAFLRMRPAAFPTIRLSQLAVFIQNCPHFFQQIREAVDSKVITKQLMVTASDYWNDHYRLDEPAAYRQKHLGKEMAENILINTVIPVLFAYGLFRNEISYREKAIRWLYETGAEQNRITRQWKESGVSNWSALDSQALIELTNFYCAEKRCLHCAAGNKILKNSVL